MSLSNPTALMWLLLAVPVVIFYILKIRLKRVPVSTVLFWRQIFDEKKPRSLWQRLRHLVSLLVQLLLLALVVAALTEPFFSWEATNKRRIILVIDNSASMKAGDVAPSRLAKALEEARTVINGLRFRDEMAIISAGTQPRVVCGLTGHQRTLREALDTITPTDGPGKLKDAIDTARRLVNRDQAEAESRVVVISDGSGDELAKVLADEEKKPDAEQIKLSIVRIGGKTPNVGITRFQVRRSTVDPIGYEALTEIVNFSDEPSGDIRLETVLNSDKKVDVVPLNLKPGETWTKTSPYTTAEGGVLTARLTVKGEKGNDPYQDALLADNIAIALLPRRDKIDVHFHTAVGNLFLQKVLEANSLVQLTTTRKELPKDFPAKAIKVFHRDTPADLPPGNVLVVDPQTDTNLWKLGNKLPAAIVTKQEKDSSYMAHVRLDNVILPDARLMTFTPAAGKPQVLASSLQAEPLITLIERPEGKVVVLTSDLDKSELPFRTAFPILVMNTLGIFAGAAGELRESLPTGATADVTLPTGEFVLRAPDGSTKKLPTGPTKTTVGPFDACGVWSVAAPEPNAPPVEEFAVNLMSRAESNLGDKELTEYLNAYAERKKALPEPPKPFFLVVSSAGDESASLIGGYFGRPVWWYLTIAAFVLAALEWYLYQRRWIS